MRLELIEWADAYGCGTDWQELDEGFFAACGNNKSVGWVFRETEEFVVVIPHVADVGGGRKGQGCGDMTIPKVCVVKREVLRDEKDSGPGSAGPE